MNAAPGHSDHLLDTTAAGPTAVRGGLFRVGGYAVGSLASVASAALLFRHLGVVDTGRYITIMSLIAISGGVSDLGLTSIGVRELSVRSGPSRETLARNLLGVRLVVGMLSLGATVVFALAVGYPAVMVLGTAVAGAGLLLQSVQGTMAMGLLSSLRLGWAAAIDLLRQVGTTLLIVLFVLLGSGLLAFVAISIPIAAVTLAATIGLVRRQMPVIPTFDRAEWRELARLVLPYSLAVAAGTLYFRVAIVIASLLATGRALGYFSASFRVVEVLLAVPALLVGAAFPIFSRAAKVDPERFSYGLGRVLEVALICGVGVGVCLGLGRDLIIDVIGGHQFRPAAPLLAIQGIALAAAFVGAVWAHGLLSLGRHRAILYINVGALLGGLVVATVLTLVDGVQGTAIAMAFDELALALLGGAVILRSHPQLRVNLEVLPRIAAAAGLAGLVVVIPGWSEALTMSAALGVYLAALIVLRALPPELLDAVPTRLRPGRSIP